MLCEFVIKLCEYDIKLCKLVSKLCDFVIMLSHKSLVAETNEISKLI